MITSEYMGDGDDFDPNKAGACQCHQPTQPREEARLPPPLPQYTFRHGLLITSAIRHFHTARAYKPTSDGCA